MAQLTGQGVIIGGATNTSNPLSQTSPNPGGNLPLGTRMTDVAGNVYILCDAVNTMFSGLAVLIQDDHTVQTLTTSITTGRIGVCQANATSDNLVWVQVYGRAIMQVGGSNVSPSELLTTVRTSAAIKFVVPTSLSSPASIATVTDASSINTAIVVGMWIANDVSLGDTSAVTSATSHVGSQTAVFLNYPILQYAPGTGDAS